MWSYKSAFEFRNEQGIYAAPQNSVRTTPTAVQERQSIWYEMQRGSVNMSSEMMWKNRFK